MEHVYGKFVQNNHGMANNVPHREKRAIDLDRNPTLYSYYSGLLNNINDKRNPASSSTTDNERKLEKIILLQDSFEPYDYASSARLVEEPLGKRNFDEIDRALIGGLKKRLSTYKLPRLYNSYDNNSPIDASSKRNFDEIDRAGFTTLKRNGFDEIDRAGFVSLKRNLLNLANSADRYPSASRSAILNGYSMEKHD